MNEYKCPTEGCANNATPIYFENAELDVECSLCGSHAPTAKVKK